MRPRSFTHRLLANSLTRVLAAFAMLSVGACGGGSSGSAAEESPSGRVVPAHEGLVFVEFDEDGRELQRSTRSDTEGRFQFDAALRGVRIAAVVARNELRVAPAHSARVAERDREVEVTALTTWLDQAVESGRSSDAAMTWTRSLLQEACGTVVGSLASGLEGGSRLQGAPREVLLPAVGAYMGALRSIGVDTSSAQWWPGAASDVWPLLREMCAAVALVNSEQWLAAARRAVEVAGSSTEPVSVTLLVELRPRVLQELLVHIGRRAAQRAYPQLQAVPAFDAGDGSNDGQVAIDLMLSKVEHRAAARRLVSSGNTAGVTTVRVSRDGTPVTTLSGTLDSRSDSRAIRVTNSATEDRVFRLAINDFALGDLDRALVDVLATPQAREGEPLQERAWRYATLRHRHFHPITAGRMIHQPDLYLRSLGTGYCDDAATVLHWVWRGLGFDARVHFLNGHLVPEVHIAGRWEMYDADYRIFVYRPDGPVAGVDDIAANPAWLTNPLVPMLPLSAEAYSQRLADIYATTDDNQVAPWYSEPSADPLGDHWTLPAGAYLEIPRQSHVTVPTINADEPDRLTVVRLWLPPGFAGTLSLPLLLVDVVGDGSIHLFGQGIEVTPSGVADRIAQYLEYPNPPDVGVARVQVDHVGEGGLSLLLAVNAVYLTTFESLTARVEGQNLVGLEISRTELDN